MEKSRLKVSFAIIATLAITLAVGLSQTDVTHADDIPKGNNLYIFAEGVYPQATFEFRDSTVTYDFQLLSQTSGFGNNGRGSTPEFTLTRIAGNTPELYEAVDQTQEYSTRSGLDYPYKEFDVTVNLIQTGKSVRTFEYERCSISNYKVDTRTDNEEGYTTGGKTGFAVTDIYSFTCAGYDLQNPQYNRTTKAPYE